MCFYERHSYCQNNNSMELSPWVATSLWLENFPSFHGIWRFITLFIRTCHWPPSWARWMQPIPPQPTVRIICWLILTDIILYCSILLDINYCSTNVNTRTEGAWHKDYTAPWNTQVHRWDCLSVSVSVAVQPLWILVAFSIS